MPDLKPDIHFMLLLAWCFVAASLLLLVASSTVFKNGRLKSAALFGLLVGAPLAGVLTVLF